MYIIKLFFNYIKNRFMKLSTDVFFFFSKHPIYGGVVRKFRFIFDNVKCTIDEKTYENYFAFLELFYKSFTYQQVGEKLICFIKVVDFFFGKGFFFSSGVDFYFFKIFFYGVVAYYHLKVFFFFSFTFIDFPYIDFPYIYLRFIKRFTNITFKDFC